MLHLLAATAAGSLSSNLIILSAIVGSLLPAAVAVVQREHWPAWVRSAVGVGCIVVASVITALADHKLNWHDWAASMMTIFLLTKTTYLSIWKPSGWTGHIERATKRARGPDLSQP